MVFDGPGCLGDSDADLRIEMAEVVFLLDETDIANAKNRCSRSIASSKKLLIRILKSY